MKKNRRRINIKRDYAINRKDEYRLCSSALKARRSGIIKCNAVEAARKAIVRESKRIGFLHIIPTAKRAITAKSVGVRMGKGKGSIKEWGYLVQAGDIIFKSNKSIGFIGGVKKI